MDVFIHDMQSGEVQMEKEKGFRKYIHNAENDQIKKTAITSDRFD